MLGLDKPPTDKPIVAAHRVWNVVDGKQYAAVSAHTASSKGGG